MSTDRPIQIDVAGVLRDKLGKQARYVPGFVTGALARVIHQDELNTLLCDNFPRRGADFCRGVMKDLDIEVVVANPVKFPERERRRLLIVSNHPLGGLDGVALINTLSGLYGDDIKFVVNDLLMAIEPLSDVFLPINKHGSQSRDAISAINEAMASDCPVMVFPAGLVSRRQPDGSVRDLQWQKMFVVKAIQYKRDVLPIFFSGENTSSFYRLAQWRARLGIKFNIEMTRLPAEMLKARGSRFTVVVGDIIPWQQLRDGDARAQAARVRDIVYSLRPDQNNDKKSK